MIERYTHPEMHEVWTERAKLQRWLKAEVAIATAGGYNGLARAIGEIEVSSFYVLSIAMVEEQTHHDVAAFVEWLETKLERDCPDSRFVHYGATSSDVVDTGLALAIRDATTILANESARLSEVVPDADLTAGLTRWGRTHGRVAALTTTQWPRLLVWEFSRLRARLASAGSAIRGRIAGPLGDHPILTADQERMGLEAIGLTPDNQGSQIVSRDRLVGWANTVAQIATACEKLATWVRFENIEGIDQVSLDQPEGYVGSSSMPHKRNPSDAERICGLAHLVRANARAIEDVSVPWGDHSLEHSSVERIALPLISELTAYLLVESRKLYDSVAWTPPKDEYLRVDTFRELHRSLRDNPELTRRGAHRDLREGN